jgi:hypothetical protein
MKYVWTCRRTFLAVLGMLGLFVLGLVNGSDVASSIAAVAIGLAAANAGEAVGSKRVGGSNDQP